MHNIQNRLPIWRADFFLFILLPVEIVLEDESDTLLHIGLSQRVLIHRVRVGADAHLTIGRNHIFYVQVAEYWPVADVVVAITHIAVYEQSIHRLQLEHSLVFLRSIGIGGAIAVAAEIEA